MGTNTLEENAAPFSFPDGEGSMLLKNTGTYVSDYTAS